MDHSNFIFVEHGHDFNRYTKFTITENIEKDINIKSIIEKRKRKKKRRQIKKKSAKIYVFLKFNMKLNHPPLKYFSCHKHLYK